MKTSPRSKMKSLHSLTSWTTLSLLAVVILLPLLSVAPSYGMQSASVVSYAQPQIYAPEPAAATLSGMGLAGAGWYLRRLVARRRFKSMLAQQAAGQGFVLVDYDGSVFLHEVRTGLYLFSKRAFDIIFTSVVLLALAPVFLAVAVAIYIDSPGPVFYRQERLGEGRKRFKLFKFRSMCMNADQVLKKVLEENEELRREFEEVFKLKNDPRVTRIGAFLRKTSLDELPQLINVIRGEISLVGPRPIVDAEVERYWPFEERLFTVKPGMTGLWQISGRNDTTYEERVRLDMRYISERSFGKDFKILAGTIPALLKRNNGAY